MWRSSTPVVEGVAFIELLHLNARRDQDFDVRWDAIADVLAPFLVAPLFLHALQNHPIEVVQEA